ncbi:S-adenosylhomocysteine hydrolase [Streptosporangium album]|uniref:S-adenosylhomocysteine hydrolase n=1 Tax=Streptosporangium album TaxID=47479 RepID=A0A7W7RTH8_9ACTN|nr:hypothetical protein [Streptosporangium album]MBB4937923.1 S-adenosylhomocysteine hydrolase [Streptosporangium album]
MSDGHRRAQTAIQAILRLTNLLMTGKRVAVIGHEPELAARLRAMGAQTLVADPAAALDGHRVMSEDEAVAIADLVVGATEAHLPFLRDGAIVVRAEPSEMSRKPDLYEAPGLFAGMAGVRVRDGVTGYRLGPGREVFVLDLAC